MSGKHYSDRRPTRLAERIEVEVVPNSLDTKICSYSGPCGEAEIASCLDKLMECLHQLDQFDALDAVESDQTEVEGHTLAETIRDMKTYIQRFQKQSSIMKKLLTKVH